MVHSELHRSCTHSAWSADSDYRQLPTAWHTLNPQGSCQLSLVGRDPTIQQSNMHTMSTPYGCMAHTAITFLPPPTHVLRQQ